MYLTEAYFVLGSFRSSRVPRGSYGRSNVGDDSVDEPAAEPEETKQ